MQIKESFSDKLIKIVFIAFLAIFALYCLIPFLTVISGSITSERSIITQGFSIWPREISLEAYKLIFQDATIYRAYGVTVFITVVGTVLSMLATSSLAYPLAVKTLKYRGGISFFVYFTMLFSGGLVASYLLISKYLQMKDTIWVLIIPALINPWNMMLLRNFFQSIDESIAESAKIDGANEMYILFKIIIPISMPAIATISLFYALAYWNSWFGAMLYISDSNLYPLQYLIMRIMTNADFAKQLTSEILIPGYQVPTLATRMATTVVTIGPIIFLYPFLQKYFVKGIMVGAVKG